jgi:phenylacetic acid degradation protein
MAKIYAIDGIVPVVDPNAFVHPTAVLIGDVIVGPGCYVGPVSSLRGDFGRLILEEGANLQDTCVMHGFPGTDTVVEVDGHIGHGAVLHGCRVKRNAMVGMCAVIMDGAFVKSGFEVPPRTLVAGIPAKVIRALTEEEIAWKFKGTVAYQELALRSLRTMQEVEPLTQVEPDRKRISVSDVVPLYIERQKAK